MKQKMKTIFSTLLVSTILLAAGCTAFGSQAQTPLAPTEDINAVRTEVASTVEAQITYEAALTQASAPSETPVPPTNTVIPPTNTEMPTLSFTPTLVQIFTPTSVPSTISSGSFPTFTPTFYPDQAQLIAKNIPNGKTFPTNAEFDIVWTVKNTGTRAWTTDYYIKYSVGVAGSDATIYHISGPVAIGGKVDLRVDMLAPSTPGNYTTTWSLINNDGTTFYTLYYSFTVN